MSSSLSALLDQILSERNPPSQAANHSNGRRSQVRLAFLYQCDSASEYTNGKRRGRDRVSALASLLSFELLSAHWFRKVWQSYLSVMGHGSLPGQLEQALGNQGRIQDRFNELSWDLRQQLYEAHFRYSMRMLSESDPAPVGLAELIATPTLLRAEHVREGDWYLVEYHDGGSLPAPRQPTKLDEIVYSSIGLSSDRDGPPRRGKLLRIVPLAVEDHALHALLQALHFPQAAPQANTRPGEQERPPREGVPHIVMDGSQHFVMKSAGGAFPLSFARRRDQPTGSFSGHAAPMNTVVPGGLLSILPLSPAGSPGASAVTVPAQPQPQPQPQAQCNPMASGPQSFVGVNKVGAGNNMALYGRDGLVAYIDFGAPLSSNANTAPVCANPCVCGDPPIILSHWDYDHYAMARKVSMAWQRRWLAPQQVMGSVAARELYVRLLVAAPVGGALALWPVGTGPTHLELPFGYVERGTGAPVNDDCLAIHVRTRDDPTGPLAAPWPAIFASRPAPSSEASIVRRRAVIVDNGLQATWFNTSARIPPRCSIAISFNTGLLWCSQRIRAPGEAVWLHHSRLGLCIRAYWIPATGIPVPSRLGGGTDIPILSSGAPWLGGWAISAPDFVDLGGCIIDFPPKASGIPVNDVICISPTPGTIWAVPTAQNTGPGPGGATWFNAASGWKPIWRSGGWMLSLPAVGASALAPLPAGPTYIAPTPGTAPVLPNEEYILLPGDAGYQHLPSLQARLSAIASGQAVPAYVGMVATHHGSDSWIPTNAASALQAKAHIPAAATAKIVYSYGTRIRGPKFGAHCYIINSHGHPRPDAVDAHRAFGWGTPSAAGPYTFNRLNTAPHDFESDQPFNPLGVASGTKPAEANLHGHYNGNVALAPGMSSVVATLIRTCPHCGQRRAYYF